MTDDFVATAGWNTEGRARAAYVAVGLGLFLLMLFHTLNEQWTWEFFLHLGAVREFAEHPLNPGNPFVTGTDPDPNLTPYAWIVGQAVRLTGLDAVTTLAAAGLGNLVLVLVGLYRFVRRMTPRLGAPVLTLILTLTAWGISPWREGGFLHLNALGFVLPTAATFATGLALLVLAELSAFLNDGSRWSLVSLAVGIPVVILSHPATALWAGAIGLGVLVAADWSRVRHPLVIGVVLIGCALCLAWPFFPILGIFERTGSLLAVDDTMYRGVLRRTFLVLPGLVALGLRIPDGPTAVDDPILLGALLAGLLYLFGWLPNVLLLGFALPGVVLMLHLALARALSALLTEAERASMRWPAAAVAGAIVLAGTAGSVSGLVRAAPRSLLPASLENDPRMASVVEPYRPLTEHIGTEDVVIAYPQFSLAVAAMTGRLVASPVPAPFVPDFDARRLIRTLVLTEDDPARRVQAIRDRRIRWIVASPDRERILLDGLTASGVPASVTLRTTDLVLLHLPL